MSWKDNVLWKGLKDGTGCAMCKDMSMVENEGSYLIAEKKFTYVRLPKNQNPKGWVILVFKRHACELFEMAPEELAGFWQDVASVAAAVKAEMKAVKIHYGVFGSLFPHIHCHVIPKQVEDDPHAPVAPGKPPRSLNADEYAPLVEKLRQAISQ